MSEKKFTVCTKRHTALPRSPRLRALGVSGVAGGTTGSAVGGDTHPNREFLDTLGNDEVTEDGVGGKRRIYLDRANSAYMEYDASTGCLVCSVPIASAGDVSAFAGGESGGGSGGDSGSGGSSYQRLDAWSDYDSTKAGYVLSALLGIDLDSRVKSNAADIADAVASMASMASRVWVRDALGDYLPRQPQLEETTMAGFVLMLSALDGTYTVQGFDLTGHAVPSATEATHAQRADSATTATEATHAQRADSATTATEATSAGSAAVADKAKQLQTARKIYGRTFDGTADVDGTFELTGVSDGAGLWGTSTNMRVTCSTSAGTLWTAGDKSWGQSTFQDGKIYWWTQDGEQKEHVATYTPEGKALLLNCAARVNGGLTLPADVRMYLSQNKTVWLYYDSARDVVVCNKPIVTAGDVTAFDTQSE